MLKEITLEDVLAMKLSTLYREEIEEYKKKVESGEKIIFKLRIQKYCRYIVVYKYSHTNWKYYVVDLIPY